MDAELIYTSLEQIRQNQLTQAGLMGEMKASMDGLCGPTGRVTKLEAKDTRQWYYNMFAIPVIAFLHSVARKFGY